MVILCDYVQGDTTARELRSYIGYNNIYQTLSKPPVIYLSMNEELIKQ